MKSTEPPIIVVKRLMKLNDDKLLADDHSLGMRRNFLHEFMQ